MVLPGLKLTISSAMAGATRSWPLWQFVWAFQHHSRCGSGVLPCAISQSMLLGTECGGGSGGGDEGDDTATCNVVVNEVRLWW